MNASPDDPRPEAAAPRRRLVEPASAVFALIVAGACAFGLYEVTHARDKPTAHRGTCSRSLDIAQSLDAAVRGDVAALMPARRARDLTSVAFDDADGRKTTIGAFAGRTVLLNLWATWCVPCRAEMPALDHLESQLGSRSFGVVPVDVDQLRLEKARSFFKDTGVTRLPYYSDASADILRAVNGEGLPTTILIGPDGCEVATMSGPAQWDSPDAKALIEKVAKAQSERS